MKKFLDRLCYIKNGFSLMEMMIVLLIVSIIAAATAPMIAKKAARSAGGTNGAIGFMGIGNNFGNTNNNDNAVFILGANRSPVDTARTFLNQRLANDGQPHIVLGVDNALRARLFANNNNGIAFGNTDHNPGQDAIEIGTGADASGRNSIALGSGATATTANSVAIGNGANPSAANEIMISNTNNNNSTIRIGKGGDTIFLAGQRFGTAENGTITLGNKDTTVVIPGNIVVDNNMFVGDTSYLGYRNNNTNSTYVRWMHPDGKARSGFINSDQSHGFVATRSATEHESRSTAIENTISVGDADKIKDYLGEPNLDIISDRRLKKIGKKYTSGLEELKKLDSYNFTFKNDKDKIPQVGVMAQDLQKVFPNAVWEGTDKYLRIRWDEMFYAIINAVKELDNKISEIANQVKSNVDLIKNMQAQIDEQKQINNEQQKTIEALEKRITKLENN